MGFSLRLPRLIDPFALNTLTTMRTGQQRASRGMARRGSFLLPEATFVTPFIKYKKGCLAKWRSAGDLSNTAPTGRTLEGAKINNPLEKNENIKRYTPKYTSPFCI